MQMQNYQMSIKKYFGKIKPEIKYILLLFLVTRILLTVVGVSSQGLLESYHGEHLEPYHGEHDDRHYSEHKYLDTWGVWDTSWYLDIAQSWYSTEKNSSGHASYAFFPLYPALIKMLKPIVGDYFISSLIVSNIALLIGCWLIYKLVKIDHDHDTALRSVKYMLIFPVSFIFSGGFSESLFIALLLASFYFAKTDRWLYAGMSGFFLALTRSLGVFTIFPLAYIYLKRHGLDYRKMGYNLFWLLLIPLGLGVWSYYNYRLTGDWLAFVNIQSAWKRVYANPLIVLYNALIRNHFYVSGGAGLAVLLLINIFYRKIGFAYWLLGMYSIIIPMSTGIASMPRFTLAVFPIFIIFAIIGKNKWVDDIFAPSLAVLQGYFMVFWANGFGLIM